MRDEINPPDDALRRSVDEALRTLLSRAGPDQDASEVLKALRWQLAKALAEAPMTSPGIDEISFRARLAAAFQTAIDREEGHLASPDRGSLPEVGGAYQERRRWPRHPVHLSAEISIGGSTFDCVIIDLSEGGVQVQFARPAQVSELVTLRIKNGETYLARCRWASGARAGFEFAEAH